jgi:hypothetical protein
MNIILARAFFKHPAAGAESTLQHCIVLTPFAD